MLDAIKEQVRKIIQKAQEPSETEVFMNNEIRPLMHKIHELCREKNIACVLYACGKTGEDEDGISVFNISCMNIGGESPKPRNMIIAAEALDEKCNESLIEVCSHLFMIDRLARESGSQEG